MIGEIVEYPERESRCIYAGFFGTKVGMGQAKKGELNSAVPLTNDVITGQKHNVGGGPRHGEPNPLQTPSKYIVSIDSTPSLGSR